MSTITLVPNGTSDEAIRQAADQYISARRAAAGEQVTAEQRWHEREQKIAAKREAARCAAVEPHNLACALAIAGVPVAAAQLIAAAFDKFQARIDALEAARDAGT